jgi:transcription-repair coupling factor (superfamily II helicase)
MLRPLLAHADDDRQTAALVRDGGEAFVSQSLRPYLIAALLDRDPDRPAIVVAGDDRAARDLAAGLRAWLEPRTVRYYPSRGVTYESHLAPPPHLVGLRIAALDALLGGKGGDPSPHAAPVVVVSAVALSEKVPDPSMRPHGFELRTGDLIDLDDTALDLVAAGYERVDQVEDRGQFAIRGGLLDLFPATEDRAVRVDLFGDEIESLRWFSTFTQRSLGDADVIEVAPAAELAPEHRELAEIAALEDASERPDIAELLPVESFHSFLALAAADASVLIAGAEDLAPALADHWQDVTAAFHDDDADHLYVDPDTILAELHERVRIRLSSIDQDQPYAFRAQTADIAARGLKEAEPELEKLARSGYRTVLTFARRGEGERLAYNLGRLSVHWLGEDDGAPAAGRVTFAQARLQVGFIAPQFHLAVIPDHRLFARRRAAAGGRAGREHRRGVLRSFSDLRSGDIVVHEDHGIARFAGFDTKTVAGVTRDYLYLEYAGSDRVFVPVDQLAKISRYVGGGGAHPPLSKLGGTRWDTIKSRARRAAQELAGELVNH